MTLDDSGFNAPPPSNVPPASPSGPSTPDSGQSPFHSQGAWKRNLLIVVGIVVLAGAGYAYYEEQRYNDFYEDYYAYEYYDDYYDDSYYDDSYDDYYDDSYTDYSVRDTYRSQASAIGGYMTYTDLEYFFQIDYPSDWDVTAEFGAVHVTFTTPYSDVEDYFSENANITTEDISYYGDLTLTEYGDAALGQMTSALPEYVLIDRGTRTMGTYDAGYLVGAYDLGFAQSEILSVFTIVDETVYIMTFTNEAGNTEFDAAVDQMLETFGLI